MDTTEHTIDYTRLFAHAYRQSNMFFAARLKELNIQAGQFPHLMCVCHNPGLTQDQIAAKTRTDKSTVAKMVKQLVESGYLMRHANEDDRRSYQVYPTQKALDVYPIIAEEKRKWHETLTSNLTQAEKYILQLLLEKLKV